ncbi:MAG: hypothetical protein DRP35_04405 [Candidatus Zixiibacteriota bacterium]|nr:MAG: hypothetical protein DRP35_04405 [candidate division Zixibacteria bacterium]
MTEKNRKIIVYIIFVLAIIYGTINLYPNKDNKKQIHNQNNAAQLENSKNIISQYALKNKLDTLSIQNKKWGADPFHALNKKISKKTFFRNNTQLVLSGIIYNDDNPVAIINKKSLRVGDKIENAKIIQINKKDVILEENGKNVTLIINKG